MNTQTVDYTQLYCPFEVTVSHPDIAEGRIIDLSIELQDFRGMPDCKVGHFGYNFWFRTYKGLHEEEYKNYQTLKQAVRQSVTKRGMKFIGFTETKKPID